MGIKELHYQTVICFVPVSSPNEFLAIALLDILPILYKHPFMTTYDNDISLLNKSDLK